jgi:hypothetical protein
LKADRLAALINWGRRREGPFSKCDFPFFMFQGNEKWKIENVEWKMINPVGSHKINGLVSNYQLLIN